MRPIKVAIVIAIVCFLLLCHLHTLYLLPCSLLDKNSCPRSNVSHWLTSMQRSCLQLKKSWPTCKNTVVFQVDADAGSLSFGSAIMCHEDDGIVDWLRRMFRTLKVTYWQFFWTKFLKQYCACIIFVAHLKKEQNTMCLCESVRTQFVV